jgi:DNA recombination protein RmuC
MNPSLQNFLGQNSIPILAVALFLFCIGGILLFFSGYKNRLFKRQLAEKEMETGALRKQVSDLQTALGDERIQTAKLETRLVQEQQHSTEKLVLIERARDELRLQFQTLAQRIFDEKSAAFSSQNSQRLTALLQPFQEQMASFRRRIDDIHVNDTKDRVSLKEEILHLRELNHRINQEAANLTRALKGDRKLQGNWGELVLERVLEQSGLRKGHEYDTQGGFRDLDNQLLKPDVIVHLPDGKDIIVDSKVSLSAWEQYVNCDDDNRREVFLGRHIHAIREHITGLGNKDYAGVKGIRSLDFVLMFMPIEAAFAKAFRHDEKLFAEAFARKIIVVSPTTLLATLRTIENIWRFEHQSRNSQEIADLAGALYNKLCNFVEDMEKIGRQLSSTGATFDAAMNKLTHGRGNIIALANALPELGVKVKKSLPRSVTEVSELDLKN